MFSDVQVSDFSDIRNQLEFKNLYPKINWGKYAACVGIADLNCVGKLNRWRVSVIQWLINVFPTLDTGQTLKTNPS